MKLFPGYRTFRCEECGNSWEELTRDYKSPSLDICPVCRSECHPISNRIDITIPVDKFGNLLNLS